MSGVFVLAPNENWIVDRWTKEWYKHNADISTQDPDSANIIWLLADWCWEKIPKNLLTSKFVIATVHHIVPEKFDENARREFSLRDSYVDMYHVPCHKTRQQIATLTNKPIRVIMPWVNQEIWKSRDTLRDEMRKILGLTDNVTLISSFQRDTEGKDLVSPKLEKGPDRFCDIVERMSKDRNVEVLLGGWRRQYVISRLQKSNIKYHYVELAPFSTVNAMYAATDLYVVAARYEGGPQSIIECASTRTPIISTDVGFASEILSQDSIFDGSPEGALLAKPDVQAAFDNVSKFFIPSGFEPFRQTFQSLGVLK